MNTLILLKLKRSVERQELVVETATDVSLKHLRGLAKKTDREMG